MRCLTRDFASFALFAYFFSVAFVQMADSRELARAERQELEQHRADRKLQAALIVFGIVYYAAMFWFSRRQYDAFWLGL